MLSVRLKEEPDARQMAEHIRKDAAWLHALVENILTLTKLQDQELPLSMETEVVEEIVGGAVARVTELHPKYEIEVELPEKLLMAPMDAKLIEQVIINLLENAIKHSPEGGTVLVSLSDGAEEWMLQGADVPQEVPLRDMVMISVCDAGTGIRAKDLDHIFELFYSAERRQLGRQRSYGLGLSICETITRAHHGLIAARNRIDTQGAEFAFAIPGEKGEEIQ